MTASSKSPKKDMDMLNGSLWNKILIFAIPIALTTLMQQLFHSMDMAVIGQFTGKNELAAVGSNNSIINLLVNLFMGFSSGSNVVIAQLLGAGKIKTAKKAIYTSLSIALISGIAVMILGVGLARVMLNLISSPPEVIDLATLYLRIYFLGTPFIMVYNFSSAILRSRGETTKPFYCLVAGGIVNVVLNLVFVIVFKWSVAGVAIATVISNVISCCLILLLLSKDKGPLGINLKEIKLDKFILSRIFKIGLPMGIQSCLFPFSNMVVQSAVNSLGTVVIAGNAAAQSIEAYSYAFMGGFTQAALSFVSQNFGAKNIERCQKSLRQSLLFSVLVCSLFNLIMYFLLDNIVGMFTNDLQVAVVAKERLIFMYISFSTAIFMDTLTSSLRVLGYSMIPTIVSIIGVCGFRIIWVNTVFNYMKNLFSVLLVYPISWSMVAIVLAVFYIFIVRKLKRKMKSDN